MVSRALSARRIVFATAIFAALAGASQVIANDSGRNWSMIGHDPENSRSQPFEHDISASNASRLTLKWVAPTAGDVSATPAVVDGAVYFGDFGGMLWKLDADDGTVIWSHAVTEYTGIAGDIARTSPSVFRKTLIVGDLRAPNMLGIDTKTGALKWKTQVHPDPHGIMTGSPVLAGDIVITGVSSSGGNIGPASTFRGEIVALNAQTGKLLWRRYSMPDNGGVPGGYAGATMIAPPAVDLENRLVFATFGNEYTRPASVNACHAAHGGFSESCEVTPGAFYRSIVALDLRTGEPRWSYRVFGHDPWVRACGSQPPTVTWCLPESDAQAWDLGGSGANVFDIGHGRNERTVVGVGEKSGVYVVLDAKTGAFVWNTLVGPGADQGGFEWGTATDGDRIYTSITNQRHTPYTLMPSGTPATGGNWGALDPETGKILWQTGDPVGAWDLAPITVANRVVYASSMAKTGNQFFALDARTGAILWQYPAGSSVNSGPAVADGSVYWGTGYSRASEGSGNNKLFAFTVPRSHGGDDGDDD